MVVRVRIAVPTRGKRGLEDEVSDVFGRAEVFTIVEVVGGSISGVEVLENPAASYKHGAGPITIKMLADKGVNAVVASEFGLGAQTLLDQNKIRRFRVEAGTPVREAVDYALKEMPPA